MITFDPIDLSPFIDTNIVWDHSDNLKEAAKQQFLEYVIKAAEKHAYECCEFARKQLYSGKLEKVLNLAAEAGRFKGFAKMRIGENDLEFSFTLSSELLFDFDIVSKWTYEEYITFRSMLLHADSFHCCQVSLFKLTNSAFENTPNLRQILDKNTSDWPINTLS